MSLLSCCVAVSPEKTLLSNCYPPPKQLPPPSSEIDQDEQYKPLSQDLGKLCYHATNRPGKLHRLGRELCERVAVESRRAKAGNARSRIYLLISLSITRALISECKRDLQLFSESILEIVDQSLSVALAKGTRGRAGQIDLEVAARAGAVFAAFATYSESALVGAADHATACYLSSLRQFAALATISGSTPSIVGEKDADDDETRNRTRLTGLSSLSAAAKSEGMYASSVEFAQQIQIVLPALLENLSLGNLSHLKEEAAKAEIDQSPSPFFRDLSRPPLSQRRAPSLRGHVPGEKGPSTSDVIGAALRTLRDLVGQCHPSQLVIVLNELFAVMDKKSPRIRSWQDSERYCFILECIGTYTAINYRYTIPSAIIDVLLSDDKAEAPTTRQSTLVKMLTTILGAPRISIMGLSTTDVLDAVIVLILRRIEISNEDLLIAPLVSSIESLSVHVYYADQANDMVEGLIGRIEVLQGQAVGTSGTDDKRNKSICTLIACLVNLMRSAVRTSKATAPKTQTSTAAGDVEGLPAKEDSTTDSGFTAEDTRNSTRNPIAVEIFQSSLNLLCDSQPLVRIAYSKALMVYLKQEIPNLAREALGVDASSGAISRFFNALHATLYTLAVSPGLGFVAPAADGEETDGDYFDESKMIRSESPLPSAPDIRVRSPTGDGSALESAPGTPSRIMASPQGSQISIGAPKPSMRGRRMSKLISLPSSRLEVTQSHFAPHAGNVASATDFEAILQVLSTSYRLKPFHALITLVGVPMLLALDQYTVPPRGIDGHLHLVQREACRRIMSDIWLVLADVWKRCELKNLIESDPQPSTHTVIRKEPAINLLSEIPELASSVGLPAEVVRERLSAPWTVAGALKASVGSSTPGRRTPSGGAEAPKRGDMGSRNASRSSFNAAVKEIDINDLREALGGGSATNSAAPSVSTVGMPGVPAPAVNGNGLLPPRSPRKPLKQEDVKDILKNIIKDKRNPHAHEHRGVLDASGVEAKLTSEQEAWRKFAKSA